VGGAACRGAGVRGFREGVVGWVGAAGAGGCGCFSAAPLRHACVVMRPRSCGCDVLWTPRNTVSHLWHRTLLQRPASKQLGTGWPRLATQREQRSIPPGESRWCTVPHADAFEPGRSCERVSKRCRQARKRREDEACSDAELLIKRSFSYA